MKPHAPMSSCEPYSEEELNQVAVFLRDQSAVVMRAARMEVASYPQAEVAGSAVGRWFPWAENTALRARLEAFEKGQALQLLLERQVLEAWTYQQDPTEANRDQFVLGAFKALYASEGFRYGAIAVQHIQQLIDDLGLNHYE